MSHGFFATIFYIPIYNALILLIDLLPGKSAGLAVILLTLIIRAILYPLSKKSIQTQLQMKRIEPEVQRIREKVKDRNEQGKQMLALYRANGVNPFAGFFLLLIQFPILIGLYAVFRSGLPHVDPTILYPFVHAPTATSISMFFLGADLNQRSLLLALLTVVTQFIQINIALPKSEKKQGGSFQTDLAHSMNVQMRYIFPLIIFPVAYFSSVLGLYLTITNIFMIFQELFVRRKLARTYESKTAK